MTRTKWTGLLVVCLLLALVATLVAGCGEEEATPTPTKSPGQTAAPTPVEKPTYDWIISEPYPEGFAQYDATVKFMDMCTEASDGRMQFEIYPGNLLGNYIDQQIAMMRNQQDFALSWPTSAVAPRADAAWLGYMYEDWDSFADAYDIGGWMNELISEIYTEDANIKLLASMPTSLCGISSTKAFDIRDLDKGVKLRHAPSPVLAARYSAQGFDPIIMNMSEVESALLLGTIDAVGFVSTPQFWQYREACPYLYMWLDGANPLQMMVGTETWDAMPKEDQDIILEVAEEWNGWAWEEALKVRDQTEADMIDLGIEVIYLSQEDWEYMASLSLPKEIPLVEQTAGKKVMDVIAANAPMIEQYRP